MTRNITAAKLTSGMHLDTDAGPAEVTNVARSHGGLFAARDEVVVTFVARGHELVMAFKPRQRVQVVER